MVLSPPSWCRPGVTLPPSIEFPDAWVEALLEEVYRTAGAVDYLQQQVRAHTGGELVFGVVETASLERPASAQGDKDETPASRRRNEAHGAP